MSQSFKDECRAAARLLTEEDKRRFTYLHRLKEIARIFGWTDLIDETASQARELVHEIVQRPIVEALTETG